MSSSSSSNNSYYTEESNESCVVQNIPTIKPRCKFVVKGGDIDDYGATFNVPYESPFHFVYADYARKLGVHVRDIKLCYHRELISPDTTPFELGFVGNEIIAAYGEDMETPMPLKVNNPSLSELLVFNITDMMDQPVKERLVRSKIYKLKDLYAEWGARRDVAGGEVTIFLKGMPLDHFIDREGTTLIEAGLFDGALLYGRFIRFD